MSATAMDFQTAPAMVRMGHLLFLFSQQNFFHPTITYLTAGGFSDTALFLLLLSRTILFGHRPSIYIFKLFVLFYQWSHEFQARSNTLQFNTYSKGIGKELHIVIAFTTLLKSVLAGDEIALMWAPVLNTQNDLQKGTLWIRNIGAASLTLNLALPFATCATLASHA